MFFTTKAVAITRRVGWRRWRHIGLVHAPRHWLQSTHAQATQMSANPCSLKYRRVLIWSLLRLICRLSRSHSHSICIQDIGESHAWLCTATPLPTHPTHTHILILPPHAPSFLGCRLNPSLIAFRGLPAVTFN